MKKYDLSMLTVEELDSLLTHLGDVMDIFDGAYQRGNESMLDNDAVLSMMEIQLSAFDEVKKKERNKHLKK